MLKGKVIALGITGGIAAYKGAEIASRLKKLGADVHCVMTQSATEFITPLTLRTLTSNPVTVSMFQEPKIWNVEHIGLADAIDAYLIAPATANIIGKVANGIADDFLSTTIMATKSSVIFAPAMNVNMLENSIYQENVEKLKKHGYMFIEPAEGMLACGYTGKGKLEEPEKIVNQLIGILQVEKDLMGKKVLVTAGPTMEKIDPVRYITNHSSGKMGYSIAEEAARRGAEVTLVSGKTNLTAPAGVKVINIESALEMYEKVVENYEDSDIVIKSAAVADYRPKKAADQKIKKKDGDMQILLERNPDILAYLGENKGNKILVGFAAETNDIKENAYKKVNKKNLDFIVANDILEAGAGFKGDTNKVNLYFSDGHEVSLPLMSKKEVAQKIIDEILQLIKK
ncbi:MAG: bifunctional phosphopantothenoylcysteine decarboxylase/phosphopantothenate--cysteine ligase CoaBC [Eubacteriales bacterium]|nr:bifunctional phosphopantothenoylcysteine decarboxylase/phosphopantothenate--cysteine ligase CoaBC [Eubacteriales bacterium]